jgi:hypothetical protein
MLISGRTWSFTIRPNRTWSYTLISGRTWSFKIRQNRTWCFILIRRETWVLRLERTSNFAIRITNIWNVVAARPRLAWVCLWDRRISPPNIARICRSTKSASRYRNEAIWLHEISLR